MVHPTETVQAAYDAWLEADRAAAERLYAQDFRFSSPPDPALDRAGFFDRCWPGAGANAMRFDFVRLHELPDGEVLVTYVATRHDGTRFQNTEIMAVRDEQITRTEVYFGWDIAE